MEMERGAGSLDKPQIAEFRLQGYICEAVISSDLSWRISGVFQTVNYTKAAISISGRFVTCLVNQCYLTPSLAWIVVFLDV